MYALTEYRTVPKQFADVLLWGALVHREPTVVLNKDRVLQCTLRYRGQDVAMLGTQQRLVYLHQLNALLRRLDSGWALFADEWHEPTVTYPASVWTNPAAELVDAARRVAFDAGLHFAGQYYLTVCWKPPSSRQQRWFDAWFVQHELARHQSDDARDLAQFCTALTRLLDGLEGVLPEVAFLTPEETLSYLHQCVSWDRHRVALPEVPMYLDVRLAGCDVHPGHTVRLGSQWLRPLCLVSWPEELGFHLPTALQQVDFPYRFTVRWLALGKTDAKRLLEDYMRKWQLQHKSLMTLVLEAITRQPGTKVNQDAVDNAASIAAALGALETDQVSYGYCTPTVLVWGDTPELLQARTRRMEQILQQQGCIAQAETVNAMAAWVGTLPGHVYHNVRKPPLPSLSLAYLMPHGAVWAGPSHDAHVQGPPLFVASTNGVPFRFVLHQGEVGNLMLLGPTRTGKSALLAFMAMQFLRYPQAQVFLFDKNYALKCATLAAGGAHYALGGDATRGVQPLGRIDRSEAERRWAQEWLQDLFTAQGFALTPDEQGEIWQALQRLAQQPPSLRRLSVFHTLFQVQRLKPALQAFMAGGRYSFFDAEADSFDVQQWTCFETNELRLCCMNRADTELSLELRFQLTA